MKTNPVQRTEFEKIYIAYFSKLKHFAQEYVLYEEDAENIVQDIFLELWENYSSMTSYTNLIGYLLTATKNQCHDFLRHKTVIKKGIKKILDEQDIELRMKLHSLEALDEKIFLEPDMDTIVQKAIEMLPAKCREIFIMNKFEGIKQKDIAIKLNLSLHTVESQMAIAYRKLKENLDDYFPMLAFLFI